MDVKFIAVPSNSLATVPVVNGQIIALTDVPGYFYDMSSTRMQISSVINVATLPVSGQSNTVYTVTTGDTNHGKGTYLWDATELEWVPVSVNGVKGNAETDYRYGDVNITPANIGLGNVENKSVSQIFAELTALDITTALGYTPVSSTEKGAANGVATLDSTGKIPNSQLPTSHESIVAVESYEDLSAVGSQGAL